MTERMIFEELRNIILNEPLWPGDTISHQGANECVKRNYAARDKDGYFISTMYGKRIYVLKVPTEGFNEDE